MTIASHDRNANPFRINLEQQKKRAKELHRTYAAGGEEAVQRVRAVLRAAPTPLKLADAQFVIARELGLANWTKLRTHVAALGRANVANSQPPTSVHAGSCLHVRCGTDIADVLKAMGLPGDFLEFSDPYVIGPVVDAPDWLARRADFLDAAFEGFVTGSRVTLVDAMHTLGAAPDKYDRIVLWFEHDSFDQLILVRILSLFADIAVGVKIELISIDRFPGSAPFWGLGQLPPEALRILWDERRPVEREMLSLGRETWHALSDPSPVALSKIADRTELALPYLAPALRRHLAELPDLESGLSLTQRLILEIASERTVNAGSIFRLLMTEREPLPWLGDLMFWYILRDMASALSATLVIGADEDVDWSTREVKLTDDGRRLLDGRCDYLDLVPPVRWIGGVQIVAGDKNWRWDARRSCPVFCQT